MVSSVRESGLRLNTNGLGDLINKRSIAREVCQAVDIVSISLNMPDAKSYNEVVRPAYGEKAFDAMLKFAARLQTVYRKCKIYGCRLHWRGKC